MPKATTTRGAQAVTRCDQLAIYSEDASALTRPYGTPSLCAARDAVAGWMREAGMTTRVDAMGTLRGRFEGTSPALPALLFGSHLDSVRDAGHYDGPLGVMVALAAVQGLREAGARLPFPIEIAAFPDEEGLRFQTTYLGSSALAGTFDHALLDWRDADGVTLHDAVLACGGDPDAIPHAALRPGEAFAYVEVHIEQGPHLEAIDSPLGIVTAISGQSRIAASFIGEAGHAGTVSMALRRDPAPAAATVVLAAESLARDNPGLLTTVGRLQATPGASNVIPAEVAFSLDVRHPEDPARDAAVAALRQRVEATAVERGLGCTWHEVRDHPAVPCDANLSDLLAQAVRAEGLSVELLPSGAGHDAVTMAAVLPVAMLFVRCAGGISHNPAESVTADDVAQAVAVIDRLLTLVSAPEHA